MTIYTYKSIQTNQILFSRAIYIFSSARPNAHFPTFLLYIDLNYICKISAFMELELSLFCSNDMTFIRLQACIIDYIFYKVKKHTLLNNNAPVR